MRNARDGSAKLLDVGRMDFAYGRENFDFRRGNFDFGRGDFASCRQIKNRYGITLIIESGERGICCLQKIYPVLQANLSTSLSVLKRKVSSICQASEKDISSG